MKLMRELRYIFPRRQRLLFLCLFFMQLVQTAMDFLSVSLILPFVNILVTPDRLDGQWWYELLRRLTHSGSHESIMLLLTFALMAVYVLKNLYKLLMIQLSVKFVSYNEVRMCAKMIRCYMNKPYTFHLQRNTSEIVRNITQDVGGAFSVISTIFNLISKIYQPDNGTLTVVYLFAVDTTMTLAISAALLLCSAIYFLVVRKKIRATGTEARKLNAKKYKAIHQAMGGIKEVKVMGREEFFADVYQDAGAKAVVLNKRYKIIASLPGILIESLCICSVLGVVAFRIANHQALADIVPSLSAFAVAAMRLMPRANSINGDINTITYNLPSLEALYADLTDSEREQRERQAEIERKKRERRAVADECAQDILVRHVSYTYPNRDEPVLRDVSLQIRHGTSVGIIGVTGAGKTTLVDLILGLLRPDSGAVCYGALDIYEDYTQWQKHIGYIPQNIYLVDDTIRSNVALGLDPSEIDDRQVWRALEDAQLADFVRSLADGLDTVVGERGIRISGGQRQRIGIARALYRDPEILFFDEATSSLDNETEAAVMQAINRIGSSKTMIIVAHRLTTIAGCDRIFKVENGQVYETTLGS